MRTTERERHDWLMVPIILGIGFLFVVVAGQWALRFSPHWKLNANMESNLDPNSDFLTSRPNGFIEPVDPSILTQPAWINGFLTPGAEISRETPVPVTANPMVPTSPATQTPFTTTTPTSMGSTTSTAIVIPSPTNTFIYYPPTPAFTPRPNYPSTPTDIFAPTDTPTATDTPIATPTFTETATSTATPTPTSTSTPDPSEPDFGGPDGNVYILTDGACLSFDLGASNAIVVSGTPESASDLVYYEKAENPSVIFMDWVIITVSESSSGPWYSSFNWGDPTPDANSNVSGITENDNQPINTSLPLYGTTPFQTGITIDVDSVGVPAGTYQWVQICAPTGGNGDGLEIDSLEVLP